MNDASPKQSNQNVTIPSRRHPFQISLGLMMLMMVIFAVVSAGFFYASQVPAVQDEISVISGGSVGSSQETGRLAQIVFIMFTFTSPLLLAGVLSTCVAIVRWVQRSR
tara:strand:+ start:620776 stop:621099 length:324 start_codon:yes stop_codon:yes gene_type:complete